MTRQSSCLGSCEPRQSCVLLWCVVSLTNLCYNCNREGIGQCPNPSKVKSDERRPPAPLGHPLKRVVKIDDTPRNVVRVLFGKRSAKIERPDDKENDL